MIYSIVKYGQPVLEKRGEDITEFDTPELHKFLDDMFESMYAAKGVGLAAPQIGVGRKIAVIDISVGEKAEDKIVMINPKLIHMEGKQVAEEGCLSLPGVHLQVERARELDVGGKVAERHHSEQADGARHGTTPPGEAPRRSSRRA